MRFAVPAINRRAESWKFRHSARPFMAGTAFSPACVYDSLHDTAIVIILTGCGLFSWGHYLNTGGWLLLTVIFSALLITVQRVERKRRNAALIILGIVGFIVARYAIYRMESDCTL